MLTKSGVQQFFSEKKPGKLMLTNEKVLLKPVQIRELKGTSDESVQAIRTIRTSI